MTLVANPAIGNALELARGMQVSNTEEPMFFRQLLNPETSTFTYALTDPSERFAVIIDPTSAQSERDLALLLGSGLDPLLILLTYTDADRATAARRLAEATGARVISKLGHAGGADASVDGGDRLEFGSGHIEVLSTPGYRDDNVSYLIGRRVFTGGALSVRHCGDGGFADPRRLYDSVVDVLFQLPDETLVYPAHHHGGVTRTTIGTERSFNPDLAGRSREEFLRRHRRMLEGNGHRCFDTDTALSTGSRARGGTRGRTGRATSH